jgi:hypothetical protein
MNKYKDYLIEFSKIYKRLMELEICLKYKIYDSIITTYPDTFYEIFKPFFYTENIYKKYYNYKKKSNDLLEILNNSNFSEQEKLKESLNLLYLSDTLKFLVEEETYYNDKKLIAILYENEPLDFNYLKSNKGNLCLLRNYIAHYNFRDYKKKRKKYIKALVYFETHIGCSLKKLHELPKLNHKPSVNEILKAIHQIEPELFSKNKSSEQANKDRSLCELYDDLAIINGWNYNELKSHWTIIRSAYIFKSRLKIKQPYYSLKKSVKKLLSESQLSLFTSPNS